MQPATPKNSRTRLFLFATLIVGGGAVLALGWGNWFSGVPSVTKPGLNYEPRGPIDTSGYQFFMGELKPWSGDASFEEIAKSWEKRGYRLIESIDDDLKTKKLADQQRIFALLFKATLFNYEGDPKRGYEELAKVRAEVQQSDVLAEKFLFTIIFAQGIVLIRLSPHHFCYQLAVFLTSVRHKPYGRTAAKPRQLAGWL